MRWWNQRGIPTDPICFIKGSSDGRQFDKLKDCGHNYRIDITRIHAWIETPEGEIIDKYYDEWDSHREREGCPFKTMIYKPLTNRQYCDYGYCIFDSTLNEITNIAQRQFDGKEGIVVELIIGAKSKDKLAFNTRLNAYTYWVRHPGSIMRFGSMGWGKEDGSVYWHYLSDTIKNEWDRVDVVTLPRPPPPTRLNQLPNGFEVTVSQVPTQKKKVARKKKKGGKKKKQQKKRWDSDSDSGSDEDAETEKELISVEGTSEASSEPLCTANKCVEECPLCLEEFSEDVCEKTCYSCKNRFHKDCLNEWLSKEPSCPLCRVVLR